MGEDNSVHDIKQNRKKWIKFMLMGICYLLIFIAIAIAVRCYWSETQDIHFRLHHNAFLDGMKFYKESLHGGEF